MTSSEANDVETPPFTKDGKSVHEVLDYLWDKVFGEEGSAATTAPVSADDLAALDKRVTALEENVGTDAEIPPADSGATPPSS